MTAPRVVGLDLSLTGTGIASSAGWCERVGANDITTMPLDVRLDAVDDLTEGILGRAGRPALICVELPAFSRAGGGVLERAALWWAVVRRLRRAEVPVAEIPIQARMRYATGKGLVSKGAVIDAVARRWPAYETGGDDNLADAVVLAAMGADHLGHPLAPMPATHRAALDKVAWPDVSPDSPAGGAADRRRPPRPGGDEVSPELSDVVAWDGCWHCETKPGDHHLLSCRGPR